MKEELKLSGWAKFGLFCLVVVSATALGYFTLQIAPPTVAHVPQAKALDKEAMRLVVLAGGVVGAAVNFAFVWGIGRLVGMLALKNNFQTEFYLALTLASTLANTLGLSLVLFFAKDFETLASFLWLGSFGVCYYYLVGKKWRPTLILTGVYAVGVLLGVGVSFLLYH